MMGEMLYNAAYLFNNKLTIILISCNTVRLSNGHAWE